MELKSRDLGRAICRLFEVVNDEQGLRRVITPMEYSGSGDKVVVRVRPRPDGFQIDENGESAFYATMDGGDPDADVVKRWAQQLMLDSPVSMDDDGILSALAPTENHIAPYIMRVSEAAQQLYALALSKAERKGSSDFKSRLKELVWSSAQHLKLKIESDVDLPIAGGLEADHVIDAACPIIIVAANSPTRLLEAEVICMQYRTERKPGRVIAVVESQKSVGVKQFERAGYYTDRTVVFNANSIESMIAQEASLA
jgi:hypothetical protein